MRNVCRTKKPPVLVKNEVKWKNEFLQALADGDKKLIERKRKRYNHTQVQKALNESYSGYCCYCEGEVGPVGAKQIEHRKPVEQFPKDTFVWNNLHLACAGCNRAKSNQWDADHPILDAVADVPVDEYLGYECSETGVRRTPRKRRGRTTVEHANLNREELRRSRGTIILGIRGVIDKILDRLRADPYDEDAVNRIAELREKCSGQYGSMFQWALQIWLDPYINLK